MHTAENQMHGGRPYWMHCDEVVDAALRFGYTDPNVLAGCWTHDVLEDCRTDLPMDARRESLRGVIGAKAELLAWAVTDEEGYPNRRTRKAATLPKTKATKGGTIVKLADRIANYEAALRDGNAGMRKMYDKEHDAFYELLHVDGVCENMWQHLKSLMLRSDAPAGEGHFEPTGSVQRPDGRERRAVVRKLLKGEGDELLMLAPGVLYGRVGNYVVETAVYSGGKTNVSISVRKDEDKARVEFARMLPAKIDRWMRPLEREDRDPSGARTDAVNISVDQLMDASAGYEDEALDRCKHLIGAGRDVSQASDRSQVKYRERDRDAIREGVRRWARQNVDIVDRMDMHDDIKHVLNIT